MVTVKYFYRRGFTLLELMISIMIIGLLTTVVIVNFQQGRRSQELRRASTSLLQNFRLAQNYTIGGNSVNFCDANSADDTNHPCNDDSMCDSGNGACINSVPLGGYGIHLSSPENYQLFADTSNNKIFDDSSTDLVVIDEYYISNGIRLESFQFDSEPAVVPSSGEILDVTFLPPVAAMSFYYNQAPAVDSAGQPYTQLKLWVTSDFVEQYCRIITVNRVSGQVSEEQGGCNFS